MHFDIVPMRARGKALPTTELRSAVPIRGDVLMHLEKETPLGRACTVASVLNTSPGPDILPKLYDAQIHSMATLGATITGVEVIDGAAYAQSWWVRVT